MQERSGDISENIIRGVSAIREYDLRDYDAEATHEDYLIGDISHIGATRLGRVLINAQVAAGYAFTLRLR